MIVLAVVMAFSSIAPVIPAEAASGEMRITPIDFGNTGVWGDSTMLTSGGKNLLMDTYIRDKYDTLIDYLADHHFYTFDIYLSHYHYDHMDQIADIIDDSRFNVGTVYLPDPAYVKRGAQSTSYCKDFLNYEMLETYKDFGGIRIEDDILITKEGCRFLGTKRIPYHPEDVEGFMINN